MKMGEIFRAIVRIGACWLALSVCLGSLYAYVCFHRRLHEIWLYLDYFCVAALILLADFWTKNYAAGLFRAFSDPFDRLAGSTTQISGRSTPARLGEISCRLCLGVWTLLFCRWGFGKNDLMENIYTAALILLADSLMKRALRTGRETHIEVKRLFAEIFYTIPVIAWIVYGCLKILLRYRQDLSLYTFYLYTAALTLSASLLLKAAVRRTRDSPSTICAVAALKTQPTMSANAPRDLYRPETYQKCREQIQQAGQLVNELPEHVRAQVRTIAQMAVRGAVLTARAVYDPSHPSLPKSTRKGSESEHQTVVRDIDKIGCCFDPRANG